MAKNADADSPQKNADADGPQDFRNVTNRVPMAVITGLVVVFILGAVLAGGSKSTKVPPPDPGVRAVVLPTVDRARTVVVPPCRTGTKITARNVAAQIETPGATVVQLPPAKRARVLLVPRCSASTKEAGAEIVAQVPSSLFVLTTGAKTAAGTKGSSGSGTIQPRSQLIVPSASAGQTVVVPPCTGRGPANRAIVLSPTAGSPTALIAPPC
jgi:hypothetical protein